MHVRDGGDGDDDDIVRVFSIRTLVAAKATEQNKELLEQILRDRKSRFLTTDFLF